MFFLITLFALTHFGASSRRYIKPLQKKIALKAEYSEACELCKNCVTGIIYMLEDGFSDDEIQVSMLNTCKLYPKEYSDVCEELGTTYFAIFLHLAHETSSESNICIKMGYCSDLETKK